MESTGSAFDVQTIIDVLRRRWVLVVSVVALTVVAALLLTVQQPTRYRASTDVLLGQPDGARDLSDAARANEVQIVRSRVLAEAVREVLGFDAGISVGVVDESNVLRLTAVDRDPDVAATIANTYASVYLTERRDQALESLASRRSALQDRYDAASMSLELLTGPLDALDAQIAAASDADEIDRLTSEREDLLDDISAERQLLLGQQASYAQQLNELSIAQTSALDSGGQVLSPADAPSEPFQPKPVQNVVSAAIAGLALAVGLAFARERFDFAVHDDEDVRALSGIPALGVIPQIRGNPNLVGRDLDEAEAARLLEAFRRIRTSVKMQTIDREVRLIGVTSAERGDGKTTTALNLAVAMKWDGQRVLLVEADMHRPRLAEQVGLDRTLGLSEVLSSTATLEEAIRTVRAVSSPTRRGPADSSLSLLLAGRRPPDAAELLGSGGMRRLEIVLAAEFDVVIFDLPPVLPVSDALVMAPHLDGMIVVMSVGSSDRRAVRRAVDGLRDADAYALGVVVNRGTRDSPYYRDYLGD